MKNTAILEARKKKQWSQLTAAKTAGVPLHWLVLFEDNYYNYYHSRRNEEKLKLARYYATVLADALGIETSEVMLKVKTARVSVNDIPVKRLVANAYGGERFVAPDPFSPAEKTDLVDYLLDQLPDARTTAIIRTFYGFTGQGGLKHCVETFGISRSRVSQIVIRSIRRWKLLCSDKTLPSRHGIHRITGESVFH